MSAVFHDRPNPSTLRELLIDTSLQPLSALVLPPSSTASGATLRLSYAQLQQQVAHVAYALHRLLPEFRAGVAVATSLLNGLEFVCTFLAITGARGIAAPLNPAYTLDENKFYLDDMRCRALLVAKAQGQAAREAARAAHVPIIEIDWDAQKQTLVLTLVAANKGASITSSSALSPQDASKWYSQVRPVPSDICLILHTSGTTSRPKAVPLSHRNLCTSLGNISRTFELTRADRTLIVMPLFHVHGLMAALLSTLWQGGSCVIPARFSATVFWKLFDDEKCTWFTAVPTIHQILVAQEYQLNPKPATPVKKRPLLRFIRSCSSALAPATFHALESLYGVPVLESYAMTEAAHQMTSNNLPHRGKRKAGSVGQGQGVKVAALDDDSNVLPVNVTGEISIQGDNITPGYLNNEEANKACFTKGWFRTGDQGYLDEEGFVYLTGRLKEQINRGGEKISPLEIDQVLLDHPTVAEAIAFPVPDAKYGQAVQAAVVLKASAKGRDALVVQKELQQWCSGKLSKFKVPDRIYVSDALPRTATGKIQRRHVATAFFKPNESASTGPLPKSKL